MRGASKIRRTDLGANSTCLDESQFEYYAATDPEENQNLAALANPSLDGFGVDASDNELGERCARGLGEQLRRMGLAATMASSGVAAPDQCISRSSKPDGSTGSLSSYAAAISARDDASRRPAVSSRLSPSIVAAAVGADGRQVR